MNALHNPSSDFELQSLAKKPELIAAEMRATLQEIPLIIIADDEEGVMSVVRKSIDRRAGAENVVQLRGNLSECFDQLEVGDSEKTSVISCDSDIEAEKAIQRLLDRKAQRGVLFFDNSMGRTASGLELLTKYCGELPSGIARVLHTSDGLGNTEQIINDGILDDYVGKPSSPNSIVQGIVQGYLKRNYGRVVK